MNRKRSTPTSTLPPGSQGITAADASVSIDGVTLLPPIRLRAAPAQIVALRGENGTGKTTLLRTLAGYTRPTTGTVTVNGLPPAELDAQFRRSVATMIGLPPLAPDLTVFDHIALIAATWVPHHSEVTPAATNVLAELGLTGLKARYPHELSSGQTQLFALAMVLVRPFDVLLLDEPEQRLDQTRLELVAQALRIRCDAGATVVMATHSTYLAEHVADVVVTLGAQR